MELIDNDMIVSKLSSLRLRISVIHFRKSNLIVDFFLCFWPLYYFASFRFALIVIKCKLSLALLLLLAFAPLLGFVYQNFQTKSICPFTFFS